MTERRLVHMEHPHLAGIELTVTPENWSGSIVCSGIDGGVVINGLPWYRGLNNRDLLPCGCRSRLRYLMLHTRTNQSALEIALAARTQLFRGRNSVPVPVSKRVAKEPESISHLCQLEAEKGKAIRVAKICLVYLKRFGGFRTCPRSRQGCR